MSRTIIGIRGGEELMSEDKKQDEATDAAPETAEASGDATSTSDSPKSKTTSGVQWEPKPDPMDSVKKGADSVKKGATSVLDSMEGKTVSMKTYVGSIIGVIILMMLARCGD
jgi:hypothetical protein